MTNDFTFLFCMTVVLVLFFFTLCIIAEGVVIVTMLYEINA